MNETTIDEIMACADWYRAIDNVGRTKHREKLSSKVTAALAAKDATCEWIEWRGGRRPPIPDGVQHQVRLRNGGELNENDRASAVAWDHQRSARDIIAYRIIT